MNLGERSQNIIHILAGLVYFVISIPNQILFRTHALDLGLYTHHLYNYRQLKSSSLAMFKTDSIHALSDHFDLYLILLSPLSWVSGEYTLLLIQIASILFGGLGVYKLAKHLKLDQASINAVLISFYLSFAVIQSIAIDYHSNVVAIMFVPWLYYFFHLKRHWWFYFILLVICIAKENMSVVVAFYLIPLLFYSKFWKERRTVLFGMLFALVYFVLVPFTIMPLISTQNNYSHFDYVIGNSISEFLLFAIGNPLEFFSLFFGNHLSYADALPLKIELFTVLFLSGAYFIFLRPVFLLVLIPILLQKLFHIKLNMIGASAHYSIEFIPLIAITAILFFASDCRERLKKIMSYVFVLGTVVASIYMMDDPIASVPKANLRFYQKQHYVRNDLNLSGARTALKKIPDDASVSAQSSFVPHLALRDSIFMFPVNWPQVSYILLNRRSDFYPFDEEKFYREIKRIEDGEMHSVVYEEDGVVLYKRR